MTFVISLFSDRSCFLEIVRNFSSVFFWIRKQKMLNGNTPYVFFEFSCESSSMGPFVSSNSATCLRINIRISPEIERQ